MKIVSVMTSQSEGGAEFAAVALLAALAGRGHETVMLTDHAGLTRGTPVRERPLALGPKLSSRTYLSLGLRAPLLRRTLARALAAEAPYDVLLLHFKKEQLLALGLPDRLTPRVAWCEWGPVPAPLRRGPAGALYRRAGRRAAAVFCVSEGTRDSVIACGIDPAHVHVLPNAVDAQAIAPRPGDRERMRAQLGIPEGAIAVGCMSRFNHKKRNDVLVDACAALAQESPPLHLVLAGEGETEADLRRRGAALGAALHIVPTPGDRASELLSACDFAAFCPSPTEGAPLAIIVAMLCGLPVVATGAEGARGLIVPGTGTIAEPEHDVAATAALLRAYRDDPGRREREGRAARAHAASQHDAAAVAARAESLL